MFLKELEIAGFKSFARSVRLELEPGITAVVGPNGSGKSNIVDAVRWVLGEQRARAPRGAKSEGVILGAAGHDTRSGWPRLRSCSTMLPDGVRSTWQTSRSVA